MDSEEIKVLEVEAEKPPPEIDWGSEKLQKAQKAIDENKYDLEAWSMLIREAQLKWIGDTRHFFERLVTTFPSTGRYWKIYIELEMKARNFEKVEKLFQRCLIKVLNIDLWKLYLAYVKETKASLPTYKEKMAQAYDFAIEKIGMDISSYTIWNDYVNFLKSVEAIGSYAENQKISAVRKVYQKGVVNPMTNIEQFWKDYMAYEQNINPIIAEKMGLERSRDYMNSRRVSKEFEAITRGLNKHVPSVPPTTHPDELRQVDLWKKYINWEKSNPMRTEDTTMMTRRVMFAYEQCLLCLGHHPDAWYEAAQFLEHSAKILTEKADVTAAKLFSDEAGSVYDRATTTLLNTNMLLYFAYADFEESRHKYEKVHQIYSKYLDIVECDPTLAYIQYMKFTRRAEGIKSARTVFKRAREDPRSRFQVFVAAALMEYYCSKDKNIAFRIFELGLKKFSDNPDYILCYIDYLSHLNEDNNTRVLFERVLSSGHLDPEKSVEIWNRFLEFESNIGDLTSIVNVEKRRSTVLQQIKEFEGKETAQLVDRYKFFDLYPCTVSELKSIGYSDNTMSRSSFHPGTGGSGVCAEREEETVLTFPRPDFSQMVPFKPKTSTLPGDHPAPGGVFPTPPAAAQLCTLLPPPGCFHGPFVAVDMLMDLFNKMTLPDIGTRPVNPEADSKLFELAKSVHWIVNEGPQTQTGHDSKRRRLRIEQTLKYRRLDNKLKKKLPLHQRFPRHLFPGSGYCPSLYITNDSEDDEVQGAPPANDIYRQRQQKRVK